MAKSINELQQEAKQIAFWLEQIIDELKGIDNHGNELLSLHSIEEDLGQLSQRAHVKGARFKYVKTGVNYIP
ncbi:MAG: hypothetical protein PHF20_01385 [Halothiobacillaceae bacterium]|nr:hypothetical protein [Halothiobacillaceae bacterium]